MGGVRTWLGRLEIPTPSEEDIIAVGAGVEGRGGGQRAEDWERGLVSVLGTVLEVLRCR
jgi:hypothetical protein